MNIMRPTRVLFSVAVAAVLIIGSALSNESRADPIAIPNSSFEEIYKPGSTTITADLGGGWTTGVGPNIPMNGSQIANFSDGTTGNAVDIPGWIGAAGWDNSYGLNTNSNRKGSVARQTTAGDGLYYYLANGGGWGNQPGGVIASDAPLANVEANTTYTLSMLAHGWGDGSGATPLVLDLLADGVALTPSSSVDPVLGGATWLEVSRTYDLASLAGSVGQALTIRLGVDRDASGNQSHFDNVSLSFEASAAAIPEPSTFVLATLGLLGLALFGWRRSR
jgi:hypothetical protein